MATSSRETFRTPHEVVSALRASSCQPVLNEATARLAAEEALEARVLQQSMLTEFAERLLESKEPDTEVLPWLFDRLREHCRADLCFSFVPDGDELRLTYAGGIAPEVCNGFRRLKLGEAVCGHVALTRKPMHVRSVHLSSDPRVALVKGMGARAYLCKPVVERGRTYGTLSIASYCLESFDEATTVTLSQAARLLALARQRAGFEYQLLQTETRLRLALEAARAVVWQCDLSSDWIAMIDGSMAAEGGVPDRPDILAAGEASQRIHPEDRHLVISAVDRAISQDSTYDVVFRTVTPDGLRWIHSLGRPTYDAEGNPRELLTLNLNVTEQVKARDREMLLMREVDHRAKNLLAVVQSVVSLTRARSIVDFKKAVTGRIKSLANVHGLLAESNWDGADLAAIVADELAPYASIGVLQVEGPSLWLDASAAQAIALVLHELVTNAAKYGALSTPAGRLKVSWLLDKSGTVRMAWRESGGPEVSGPPTQQGFGTQLVYANVEQQLGGILHTDWAREGLCATLTFPATRRTASAKAVSPQ